jgi:hypothetical protein
MMPIIDDEIEVTHLEKFIDQKEKVVILESKIERNKRTGERILRISVLYDIDNMEDVVKEALLRAVNSKRYYSNRHK